MKAANPVVRVKKGSKVQSKSKKVKSVVVRTVSRGKVQSGALLSPQSNLNVRRILT